MLSSKYFGKGRGNDDGVFFSRVNQNTRSNREEPVQNREINHVHFNEKRAQSIDNNTERLFHFWQNDLNAVAKREIFLLQITRFKHINVYCRRRLLFLFFT